MKATDNQAIFFPSGQFKNKNKNTTEELIQNQEKILCKSQAMGLPFLRTHSPADCVLGGEKTLVTYRHSPKGRDAASYTRCSPTAWALLCSHGSSKRAPTQACTQNISSRLNSSQAL